MTGTDFLHSTATSYDTIAVDYAARFDDEPLAEPLERAMLGVFTEAVLAAGGGPVLDVGCGTGRVTTHLHGLGLSISGLDLSPGMLAVARRQRPDLRYELGSMLDIDLPDGTLAGLVAPYSIIHIPDELLPAVFAEFRRVLAPGAQVLVSFQVGDEPSHRTEAWGHAISLTFRRRRPEHVSELMDAAGLHVHASAYREAAEDEKTPQTYLLARRT